MIHELLLNIGGTVNVTIDVFITIEEIFYTGTFTVLLLLLFNSGPFFFGGVPVCMHWAMINLIFKGKMPDSYRDPFFLQTTDFTLIGPLFTETTKTTETKSGQRKSNAKGPSFNFLLFKCYPQTRMRLKGTPLLIFLAL